VQEEKGYGVTAAAAGHRILSGSDKLLHREGIEHSDCETEGTVVYVVLDGVYIGYLLIADELKAEAARAITSLRALQVERIVLLTGDNRHIAEHVARELGIGEYHAELLPEEKVAEVERLKGELPRGKRLAFAGDGINDAPVLMSADVGFAMGALGSDAAIEAADVVLMDDRVDRIPAALSTARFTRRVVLQNIALALTVKAAFLALGVFGIATMWEAVIADVGVTLLAVLNAMRTLRVRRNSAAPLPSQPAESRQYPR
jgi:Cd2+/Zn2+-exporting ATPase